LLANSKIALFGHLNTTTRLLSRGTHTKVNVGVSFECPLKA
jgi:hypothetical protein